MYCKHIPNSFNNLLAIIRITLKLNPFQDNFQVLKTIIRFSIRYNTAFFAFTLGALLLIPGLILEAYVAYHYIFTGIKYLVKGLITIITVFIGFQSLLLSLYLKRLKFRLQRMLRNIGAHIGKYSVILSEYADKVIAFEPDPHNYVILKKNIEMNGLSNVIALNIAAFDCDTYIEFATLSPIGRTAHSHINQIASHESVSDVTKNSRVIKVRAMTLDSVVDELDIDHNSYFVLKIDVEGAEIEVLRGVVHTLNKTITLVIETIYPRLPEVLSLLPSDLLCTLKGYPATLNLMCTKL